MYYNVFALLFIPLRPHGYSCNRNRFMSLTLVKVEWFLP